jgi:hypothetical protein
MAEAASTEDVYCMDITPALEAERYLMEHRWRLNREPKLLERFTALVARKQVFIFILDARGRPVRQEPSYPLIELMAELAR